MSYAYNDSYYEPHYENTPADYGWIREENVSDMSECKILLIKLIEAVYDTGNMELVDRYMKLLADELDVDLPPSDKKIFYAA